MSIFGRIGIAIPLHVFPKGLREPRVVAVIGPDNNRTGRRVKAQKLVNRVGRLVRVPREPQFRIIRPYRRDEHVERLLGDVLRFLNPRYVEALQRLDGRCVVALEATEHEQATVRPTYLGIRYVELAQQAVLGDLVLDQLLDRILDGVLHLTKAHRPNLLAKRLQDQEAAEEMALAASPAAPGSLVARRPCERLKNL